MKKLLAYFVLALGLIACSLEEPVPSNNHIEVLLATHSECLGTKSLEVDDSGEENYQIAALGEGTYLIQHNNATFNCCLPEGIEMSCYMNQDTLFYTDREKVQGNCKCLCLYETEIEIKGIEEGDYVLCFIMEGITVGTAEIYFHDQLNETILVSEL